MIIASIISIHIIIINISITAAPCNSRSRCRRGRGTPAETLQQVTSWVPGWARLGDRSILYNVM